MQTLPDHLQSTNPMFGRYAGPTDDLAAKDQHTDVVDVAISPDEIDIIRCLINRAVRAGCMAMDVTPEVWPVYVRKLEQIREQIRVGPPDERSKGL